MAYQQRYQPVAAPGPGVDGSGWGSREALQCVCGMPYAPDANFCRHCGRPRPRSQDVTVPQVSRALPPLTQASRHSSEGSGGDSSEEGLSSGQDSARVLKQKNNRRNLCILVASLLALLALLGIILLVWWLNSGSKQAPTPAPVAVPVDGYDYIVVGAGAAGMVLANELSATGAKLLLIEGGGATNVGTPYGGQAPADADWAQASTATGIPAPPIYAIPGEYENLAWSDDYSWSSTFSFQGKGLGGSAAVNRMIYVRPTDAQLAEIGWPSSMIPLLKEAFNKIEQDMPMTTTPSRDGQAYAGDTAAAVAQAMSQRAQFVKVDNPNAASVLGGSRAGLYGPAVSISKDGMRANSATVYMDSLKSKPNVKIVTDAKVTRLKLNTNGACIWVEYIDKNFPGTVIQKMLAPGGKVVMAAGALNTPRLLMLSGIGSRYAVPYYADTFKIINAPSNEWRFNEYVGAGLKDHVMGMMGFSKAGVRLFDPTGTSADLLAAKEEYLRSHSGPYAQYGPTLIGYMQSPSEKAANPASTQADLQFHVLPHPVTSSKSVNYLTTCHPGSGNEMCVLLPDDASGATTRSFEPWGANSWAMYVTLLKTKSVGKVALDSNGRVKYPVYEPAPGVLESGLYLQDPDDVARLKFGMQKVFETLTAPNLNITPQLPKSLAALDNAVKSWETSHLVTNSWSSSCQVGTCLTNEFRVVNTTNVFVADASAMPQPPVQPVGTVMAVAQMAAGIIARASVGTTVAV